MTLPIPVLIVGAGPAGLVSALVLAQNGIQVRIVDKAVKYSSIQFGLNPVEQPNSVGTVEIRQR
ncbi:uncharacterized protein C8R40DRAFT_1118846 [Lentinula edodes]|uniref:uncharacterized protein n=1 Tax=Lentinula edodes TaxID=5353 RepID=UPI001E8DA1E6|nr:uncharacterized protein C8R40DRAFT_1118846 [Lentinula edodes]KAH7872223.1 hypothetical protein C8R40DRAFT_1118846 [Lentinula edodes]